jgi:hypothetical protein
VNPNSLKLTKLIKTKSHEKTTFVCFCFRVSALLLQAQKTVTGTVVSNEDNLPVPGATVMIKGTTLG